MASPRDPITCHILDTVKGTPAPNIPVKLTHIRTDATPLSREVGTARTDADGRITSWAPGSDGSIHDVFAADADAKAKTKWVLTFDVEEYFGGESFWSEIDVRFVTERSGERAHWHIPLLLSPWSYTTYRGS